MGFPSFIKLLFSQEHNAIAVICSQEAEIPKIQLFSTFPVAAEDTRALLDWFLQAKGGSSAGEPYAVTLDGLGGVEAWIAEETPGVCMYNVAFVHGGYGYYGMLMWVPQDDTEARPSMMEALQTLSVPEK